MNVADQSLKARHEAKRLTVLRETARRADQQLLREHRGERLLLEAMSETDLQKASMIIDKLRSLKGKGLTALDDAISQCEMELNKYTAGGPLEKAWAKIKSKLGGNNPLVKTLTMANALETGFKQLPTILKNNVGDADTLKQNADKSILDLVTDQGKQQTVLKNITKALSPKGIFGVFRKVPYVDMDALAHQLLSTPLGQLAPVIRQATSGVQASQIAPDLKDVITGQGDAQTAHTQQEPETVPTGQSQPGKPAKDSIGTAKTTNTGETPATPRGGGSPDATANKVYQRIGAQLEDAIGSGGDAKQRLMKVLAALADEGMLKA